MFREDGKHPEEPQDVILQRHPFAVQVTAFLFPSCNDIYSKVTIRHYILPHSSHLTSIPLIIERELFLRKPHVLHQETAKHLPRPHKSQFLQHSLQIRQIQLTDMSMQETSPVTELTKADTGS